MINFNNKFEILITEKIDEEGLELLKKQPFLNIEQALNLTPEDLLKKIPRYHALLVRSQTKVDENVLKIGTNLKLIGRAGVGLDNINIKIASDLNIKVINAPEASSVAVAELTFALMLSSIRNVSKAFESLKKGEFERSLFIGIELYNKTLGIIGFGNIGQLVANRAKAFGMKILSYDPIIKSEYFASLPELFKRADIISLHCPLTSDTKYLINKNTLKEMKKGAIIINTARGELINDEDLLESLNNNHIAMAAIDVYAKEPPPKDHPLIGHKKVLATPHLGASTIEAQKKVSTILAQKVIEIFQSLIQTQ